MSDFWKSPRKRKRPDFFNSPEHESPKKDAKKQKLDETLNGNLQMTPQPGRRIIPREDLLVWGKCKGFGWWPGRIANRTELSGPIDPPDDPTRWIKWFGDGKFTETRVDVMAYFHDFTKFFKEGNYWRSQRYRDAINEAITEACRRAGKSSFLSDEEGLKWAKGQFYPEGYTKLLPNLMSPEEMSMAPLLNGYPEPNRKPAMGKKMHNLKDQEKHNNDLDFSDQLKLALEKVKENIVKLDQLCLGCGSLEVTTEHPLFVGGLCAVCEIDYRESIYLLDDGGASCYCCVCSGGKEILLCDNTNCCRCFCITCMEMFIGKLAASKEKQKTPWICFLCVEKDNHGLLQRRQSFHENLQSFMNDENMDFSFEILPLPKIAAPPDRKPIRVLSLFDGISTGLLALKEIGIEVDCYYASEVDHEAICISDLRFQKNLKHIGDVTDITDKMLVEWGPFDLVIGGSPCNDLSIVNPARKGIWSDKGSGNLFFEFVRVLRSCQLISTNCVRPVFWMFENVVCMDHASRQTITHFLQRNPVILDAQHVSPAHRPRCFWGNLPGMKRPMVATELHKLHLQDCLEPGRVATADKLRTITTNLNSVNRRCVASQEEADPSNAIVLQQSNQYDALWITEIERIFGFPDHYTDVCNMSRAARLRVLGKAWSVPVIKHLFAPLKDFFSCSESM